MATTSHLEHAVQAIWIILPWLAVGGIIAAVFVFRELRENARFNKEHRRGKRKRLVQWM